MIYKYKLWYNHRHWPYFFNVLDEHMNLRIDEIVGLLCWERYPTIYGLISRGLGTITDLESFHTKLVNFHIEEGINLFGRVNIPACYFMKGLFKPNPWLILKAGIATVGLKNLIGNILLSYYKKIAGV